jgi:hypothetical protein
MIKLTSSVEIYILLLTVLNAFYVVLSRDSVRLFANCFVG